MKAANAWCVAVTILLAGTPAAVRGAPAPRTMPAQSVPAAEGIRLVSPLPNGDWPLPAGDLANTRFSPLKQLTPGNVAGLKVYSAFNTGVPHGHEGQPLVVNNTMYVVAPFPNYLYAIDLTQPGGALKWTFDPHADPEAVGKACCDIVNRGASYGDGKVVYNTLDGQTIAVDAATGKAAWRAKLGHVNLGETFTMAPLIVKNLVLVGNSGAELGVRGYVVALDLGSGRVVWKAYNTGPDAETLIGPSFKPFYPKDRGANLGVRTWTPDQWKLGGSTVWGWISYDPETNLIFYGTANPGVWNPDLRPGDNKWSCSIIARNADDGQARWAFQIVPHDAWDYDEIMENIPVDMPFAGRNRKLLIHPGRSGFVYVLDRVSGELLSAEKFEPTNWASAFDLRTGKPIEDPTKRTKNGVMTRDICPSSTGAKEMVPSAFSPMTGYLYIPAHNTCMDYTGVDANYIAGTPYLGASVKMYPGEGGYQGELVAWDVARARKIWTVKDPKFPVMSGVLATAGNLVFYGTMEGWFKAVDARDGRVLWQFKTGSGIIANPITYLGPDGKQYVAIYSGIGGWMGATALPSVSEDDPEAALGVVGAMKGIKQVTGPGDVLYVFAL